jgi:2-octaprenyl-6-methoxyphenol hydroxylase
MAAPRSISPLGPFAILPLTGNRSSIVWTETARGRAHRRAAGRRIFVELEKRFGLRSRRPAVTGAPRLSARPVHRARIIAERLARIGDAAHIIHPIAGQGLNMVCAMAALAEAIADAARLGLDIGAPDGALSALALRHHDHGRRHRWLEPIVLQPPTCCGWRATSDWALSSEFRRSSVFIREAAGFTGEVPKLLRGEAL